MDERLERVARAICVSLGHNPDDFNRLTASEKLWTVYIPDAAAVLAELTGEIANSERYVYWRDEVWFNEDQDHAGNFASIPDTLVHAETPEQFDKAIDEARG